MSNETSPRWARVLRVMYEEEIVYETEMLLTTASDDWNPPDERLVEIENDQIGRIAEKLDFDESSISEVLSYMDQVGLIERHKLLPKRGPFRLSEKGFEVAHDRQMVARQQGREDHRIRSQNEVNRAVGFLTLGLLFVSFTDTAVSLWTTLNRSELILNATIFIDGIVVLAIAILLYRTGMLTENQG